MKSPEFENDDSLHLAVPAQQETIYQAQRAPETENPYASPAAPSKRRLHWSQTVSIVSLLVSQGAGVALLLYRDTVRPHDYYLPLTPKLVAVGLIIVACFVVALVCGVAGFLGGVQQNNRGTKALATIGLIFCVIIPLGVWLELDKQPTQGAAARYRAPPDATCHC